MTAKKCKNCGTEVQNASGICPECGTTLHDYNRTYKKVILFVLILFNALMLVWAIYGIGGSAEILEGTNTVASEEIAKKSIKVGSLMIAVIWFVGDVILGILYFMSGKKK